MYCHNYRSMQYFFFNNIVHSIDNWSCSGTATTYFYHYQKCSCRRSLQDIFNYCVYPLLSIWISTHIVLYITSYIYCITGTCVHRYMIKRVWLTKPTVCDLDVVLVVHVQKPNTWNQYNQLRMFCSVSLDLQVSKLLTG